MVPHLNIGPSLDFVINTFVNISRLIVTCIMNTFLRSTLQMFPNTSQNFLKVTVSLCNSPDSNTLEGILSLHESVLSLSEVISHGLTQ